MSAVPLPKPESQKKKLTVEIDDDLHAEAWSEVDAQQVTMRQVVEYGIKRWLEEVRGNPRKKQK